MYFCVQLKILIEINLIDMNLKLASLNNYPYDTLKRGNDKIVEFITVIDNLIQHS